MGKDGRQTYFGPSKDLPQCEIVLRTGKRCALTAAESHTRCRMHRQAPPRKNGAILVAVDVTQKIKIKSTFSGG